MNDAQRVIFHVDMDAFYASIEQRDNQLYQGKPVIIGAKPGFRGVVSTASYEARQFGIHSAMPINEAFSRCPHGIFITPEMKKYSEVSSAIMAIFKRFTPLVECISIDEAFLDMSGTEKLFGSPFQAAQKISQTIKDEQRLTGSIGIAPNKFLAKIASDCNKPDGITVVPFDQKSILKWLAPMSINKIWGVGKKSTAALETLGIYTIEDLQKVSLDRLIHHFGKGGHSLYYLSKGIDKRAVSESDSVKSISREHTFNTDSKNRGEWKQILYELSQDVAGRARLKNYKGCTIVLVWRRSDFSRHSRRVTMSQPTNVAKVIYEQVISLLDNVPERTLRLIGVGLTGFANNFQTDLFSSINNNERLETSELTADTIRSRFGRNVLVKGRELKSKQKNKGTR